MAGRGSKPGERRGGRKKGTPNSITRTVKQAFELAFADAQADPKCPANLNNFKHEFPKEFIAAAAKLIPAEIRGQVDVQVTPKVECVIGAMVKKEG